MAAPPFLISQLLFTPTPQPDWADIVYAQSIGVWLAVSPEASTTSDKVLRSTDGLTWTEEDLPAGANWLALVWSEEAGLFAAFCTNNSGISVATSPDGITWTNAHAERANISSCVYAPAPQSKFIGVGGQSQVIGPNVFSKSNFALAGVGLFTRTVNINMAVSTLMLVGIVGNATDNVTGVTFNGVALTLVEKVQATADRFIYVYKLVGPSVGGSFALVVTFSASNQGSAIYINGYSDAGDVLQSRTDTGTGAAISTGVTTTYDGSWLAQFSINVADSTGTAGAGATVRATTDGQGGTWADSNAAKTPPGAHTIAVNVTASDWAAITVAFRPEVTQGLITSADGATWVESENTNDTMQGVAYSPELDLFVAVSAGGGNGGGLGPTFLVLTSPDGVTWTYRDLGAATGPDLSATGSCVIVWADDLGLFVVVLADGSVRKSADGITWSAITLPVSSTIPPILGVTWAKRLGLLIFSAEADVPGFNPLLYSEDGTTVVAVDYLSTEDTDGDWRAAAYSPIDDRMVVLPHFNNYALLVQFGPDIIEVVPPFGDRVGGNTVQLIGEGFVDGMEVVFDNLYGTDVVVISPTLATCVVPPHPGSSGFVNVTVTNPDDRFDVGELLYEYREPIDPATGEPELFPQISWLGSGCAPGSIVPDHGTMLGGTIVTIHGQGFRAGSSVFFGGSPATSVVIDTGQPWPELVLAKAPDAWWRLEEPSAATALVDEMGAHDATMATADGKTSVRGGLSYSPSLGIALSNSSRGFECLLAGNANFSPGIPVFAAAGTIEFLLRPVAGGPAYGLIVGDTSFDNGIYVFDNAGVIKISYESNLNGFVDQVNATPLVAGQTYHIALVLDGLGGGTWVIDGVADGVVTDVDLAGDDVTFMFNIGGFALSCELIDELAIYDVALSVPTLLVHATNRDAGYPALVLGDGAIAYWRFEEDAATATILEDSTGNGFDADTVAGGGRTSVNGGLSDGHVHAVITFGINLTGVYSIEFLINPIDVGATQILLAGIAPLGFKLDSGLVLRAQVAHSVLSDVALAEGAITHVIFTASGALGRWYVNGVLHGSGVWDNTDDVVLQRMLAGTVGGSPLVCNVLDEVVVHSVELSAADVLAHFQAARNWVSGSFITCVTPPHQTGAVDVEVVSP